MKYGNEKIKASFRKWKNDIDASDVSEYKIRTETIFVVEKRHNFVALVFTLTQAGKTRKTFQLLHDKLKSRDRNLVLFVTQANNKQSVSQTIQRAKGSDHHLVSNIVAPKNIYGDNIPMRRPPRSCMLVNFWNTRKTKKMLEFVHTHCHVYDTITIVIDEIEQNGKDGVLNRLRFIQDIEDIVKRVTGRSRHTQPNINIIFVTATVANLSKCINDLAIDTNIRMTGLAKEIIDKTIVEMHYAPPGEDYVGASFYLETPDAYKPLVFRPQGQMTDQEYHAAKMETIAQRLSELTDEQKELCLVVIGTKKEEHSESVDMLLDGNVGFNVVVEMNSEYGKDFKVTHVYPHVDHQNAIVMKKTSWHIPMKEIERLAKQRRIEGISHEHEYTQLHVLQSALFMNTVSDQGRIEVNLRESQDEYMKLKEISKHIERPDNYPDNPRVALVAGNLASRGITFQDAGIDFVFTSYCLTGSHDIHQRGAQNTQRLGRACGYLKKYKRIGRESVCPKMIATHDLLRDAYANELVLKQQIPEEEGLMVSLKTMVPEEKWQECLKESRMVVKLCRKPKDEEDRMLVLYYNISAQGERAFTRNDVVNHHDQEARRIEDKLGNAGRFYIQRFESAGYMRCIKVGQLWRNTFTPIGKARAETLKLGSL